jgi:hypothetical protein
MNEYWKEVAMAKLRYCLSLKRLAKIMKNLLGLPLSQGKIQTKHLLNASLVCCF